MAISRSIIATSLLFVLCIYPINAIYEDQVNKFDWKLSFVGRIKHAKFTDNRYMDPYLIVTTHENILASLDPKNGEIQWRQVLEEPQDNNEIEFLHVKYEAITPILTTVSGNGFGFLVRGWEASTGSLLWEWHNSIETAPGKSTSLWTQDNDYLSHILIVPESHIETTTYSLKTGDVSGKIRKVTAPWASSGKCTTAKQFLVCISNGQLFWFDINQDSKIQSESLQKLLGQDYAYGADVDILHFDYIKPAVLIILNNQAKSKLLEFQEDSSVVLKTPDLLSNAIFDDKYILQLEVNANNPEKLIKVSSLDVNTQESFSVDVNYPRGLGAPYIAAAQCGGSYCAMLWSSTDDALTFVRASAQISAAKVTWTREEALSHVVSAEFFELPVSELDASIEHEFDGNGDIISMLSHRLTTQFKQLQKLVSTLFSGVSMAENLLIRDDFGLHKIIVLATKAGKLFALDTMSGAIIWSYRLPNVKPFNKDTMMLLVQRTARHAPLPAQCVLLAQDAHSGLGVLFKFDPITGVSQDGIQKLDYKIKQAFMLQFEDENHIKPVMVVAEDQQFHVYPETGWKLVDPDRASIFVYLTENRALRGYKLDEKQNKIEEVWNVNLGAPIEALSVRPVAERVHSQGKVLPNRSVFYKYVNPNLIAVACLNDDPVHKHVLSVYLIDGITGFVMYSAFHKRAKGPVYLTHSENWLVYTFFNERFRRFEITAAEMYEGEVQNNSTYFSSFAVSQLPHVLSQSYILPANPVTMTVTLTERGITNKFLLVGLSSGGVVEIPWMLLQPRFENVQCGPEESCIPYMPEVPLPAEANINYNQTLARISGIQVAPARLESTSHVLVYGLDLFYTRVAPSKTFDVLKEDFDYRLIFLVLSGLIVASYATKYLAAKKALRQAWK